MGTVGDNASKRRESRREDLLPVSVFRSRLVPKTTTIKRRADADWIQWMAAS